MEFRGRRGMVVSKSNDYIYLMCTSGHEVKLCSLVIVNTKTYVLPNTISDSCRCSRETETTEGIDRYLTEIIP